MKGLVFQEPSLLSLLFLAPIVWWLMAWANKKRSLALEAISASRVSSYAGRDWLWLAVFVVLVLALARPGYQPVRLSSSQSGRDVVFVLDVSRSMLAEDAYPSRLETAKQGIRDCLDLFSGEQAALVIYAGSASIACPLTSDYEFLRYMLSQTQPRSVAFGGTMLLSAMEKVVDQVLDKKRRGFQDLVVLTDGEDFGPEMERVETLIRDSGVSVLVVGIGDAETGTSIPVIDEEGERLSLIHDGAMVYTRLQSADLEVLARVGLESEYFSAGTAPFHLGEVYRHFSAEKARKASEGGAAYVVYQEAAFFLMPIGFVLAMIAISGRWPRARTGLASVFLVALHIAHLLAADGDESSASPFESARLMLEENRYSEASFAFDALHSEAERGGNVDSKRLGVLSFNLGLSQHLEASVVGEASASIALEWASLARQSFMRSMREYPGLRRASLRLENLSGLIRTLEGRVEEEEQKREEQRGQVETLLEKLRILKEKQATLMAQVLDTGSLRSEKRKEGKKESFRGATVPTEAGAKAKVFHSAQSDLLIEGKRIHDLMKDLDEEFARSMVREQGMRSFEQETILKRPLELMNECS